ncbi:transmembrane protein 258-like [Psammomys obesus]|uniref:transmembrane protein 258-like n=1 Tax=Psammomys obesus TaxID=48139 RepID=UPI002452A815|nr:transmembrane protein 258-like [Psammomys obesus]
MELETMSYYTSLVNPVVFLHLTVALLAIGMFFAAWFFVYEVTSTKYTRDLYKELLISLVASLFVGFGVLFLLLWVGIYIDRASERVKMHLKEWRWEISSEKVQGPSTAVTFLGALVGPEEFRQAGSSVKCLWIECLPHKRVMGVQSPRTQVDREACK